MAIVGSYNLDPRSAYIDTELMLAIDSVEFTQHLKQVQEEYRQQSLEVGRDGAYSSGSPWEARAVPVFKRIMIFGLLLPVRLFKYLT